MILGSRKTGVGLVQIIDGYFDVRPLNYTQNAAPTYTDIAPT